MGVLQIGLEFGLYLENDLRTDLVGEINNSCDLMEACLYLGKNGFEGYYGKMLRSHILPAHLLDVSFLTDETYFRPFGGQNGRCLWFSVSLWS